MEEDDQSMSNLESLLAADRLDVGAALAAIQTLIRQDRDPGRYKRLLRHRWERLNQEPTGLDQEALLRWKQERGYELEGLLIALFALERLAPLRPYRTNGEQIDGLFEWQGRYFLLEAKWHESPSPASEIFAFRGKLEGKLNGTMGVFVSVNGFSPDAPNALIWGKEINVILFDGEDVIFSLDDRYSFSQVLQVKLRRAAQRGEVYYTFERFLDEQVI